MAPNASSAPPKPASKIVDGSGAADWIVKEPVAPVAIDSPWLIAERIVCRSVPENVVLKFPWIGFVDVPFVRLPRNAKDTVTPVEVFCRSKGEFGMLQT